MGMAKERSYHQVSGKPQSFSFNTDADRFVLKVQTVVSKQHEEKS
jgi:hypothetical protein